MQFLRRQHKQCRDSVNNLVNYTYSLAVKTTNILFNRSGHMHILPKENEGKFQSIITTLTFLIDIDKYIISIRLHVVLAFITAHVLLIKIIIANTASHESFLYLNCAESHK